MIARTLVPRDVRPPAETPAAPPRRLTTLLDDRSLVPANLPHIALDPRSSIPPHLPLDVLASRIVVPRDTLATPFDSAVLHPDYAPATPLDQRVTVPVAMPVVELQSKSLVPAQDLPAVLHPDVVTTGEVNLMVEPVENRGIDWNWISRAASIAVHAAFIVFLLLLPKIFPYHPPTQEQIDIARRRLSFVYLPPEIEEPSAPATPSPRLRVDPRILRRIAPSRPNEPAPKPMPQPKVPERVTPEAPVVPPPQLPVAPQPQVQTARKAPNFLRGPLQPETSTTPPPQNQHKLILPQMASPTRSLQELAQAAAPSGGATQQFGAPMPGAMGSSGGAGGGGGGASGYAGAGIQMLTPTEGVDFSTYLARVLASVKRNWYAVMPESARLGDQGRVVLQFRIMRNGIVPIAEPELMSSSGKGPLDRAAVSAIRTSSPFEPLPSAFSGPYIELRFIFLYNMPLDTQ